MKERLKAPELRFPGFTDDWEELKLGDITTWTKGQGLSKEYLNNERYGSEAVHYADLYKFSPVMQEVIHWTNSDDGRIIPDNSLLFPASDVTPVGLARTSTLRLSGVKAGGDVIIGQLSERIDSSFMSYQINANSKKILPLITGTTVKHVQAKSLATMSVTITNMAEQTAIAGLFERIDNLIALHQRKLDLLKEQKKGYLQKMFPKNGAKVPELRFAGFADDWEERKLGQYTKLITKGTTPKDKTGIGDVNFVKVENITNGKIYPINKIKQHEHDNYLKRSRLEEKDILFSIAGTLGRTAIVNKSILPANTNQALAIIRGYDFDTNFLITSLAGNVVEEYIRRNPTVGAQPNLSLEQVGNLLVNTPNAEEQQKIGSFFKQLDDTIALHQRKLDLLKEQKKGFLQKMFV